MTVFQVTPCPRDLCSLREGPPCGEANSTEFVLPPTVFLHFRLSQTLLLTVSRRVSPWHADALTHSATWCEATHVPPWGQARQAGVAQGSPRAMNPLAGATCENSRAWVPSVELGRRAHLSHIQA